MFVCAEVTNNTLSEETLFCASLFVSFFACCVPVQCAYDGRPDVREIPVQ